MNKVLILDTGIANLASLSCALKSIDIDFEIITKADRKHMDFSHVILPGVGAFDRGCKAIKESGLNEVIFKSIEFGKPVLGICLGMQLLCSSSAESSVNLKGLEIFDISVKKLVKPLNGFWPKIGWSSVDIIQETPLTKNIPNGEDFYFIHGYYVELNTNTIGTSSFSSKYASMIQLENTYGVQFHPEKSQKHGLIMLKNFCELTS